MGGYIEIILGVIYMGDESMTKKTWAGRADASFLWDGGETRFGVFFRGLNLR